METRSIYQGKFGSTEQYKTYFLEDRPSNKNAWEIIYDKFVKDKTETKSDEFNKVNEGYAKTKTDDKNISLNKFCAEAYSKDKSEVEATDKSSYKSNVLKFCTFTTTDLTTPSS